MNVPGSCRGWEEQLERGDDDEKRILNNIRSERCVSSSESEFFTDLAAKGTPQNSEQARRFAFDVIQAKPITFLCSSDPIPEEQFTKLMRFQEKKSLKFILTENNAGLGLSPHDPVGQSEGKKLKMIILKFRQGTMQVKLGDEHQKRVVWVSDFQEIQPELPDLDLTRVPRQLINRLGLSALQEAEECLVLLYQRDATGRTLHVPRVWDAIDHPQFQPIQDCSATRGKTRPINGETRNGLSEAIHLHCTVKLDLLELGVIQ